MVRFEKNAKNTQLKIFLFKKLLMLKVALDIGLSRKKKQKLKNGFHFRYLTSFSQVCQVAGFGTVSPLLVHKEKEGKNP